MSDIDQAEATEIPAATEDPIQTSYAEPLDVPSVADDADDDRPEGIPAGHLAAGGLSASAVALGVVYQLMGLPGLIGGGVLAGGSAVAYVQHRRKTKAGRSWDLTGGRKAKAARAGGSALPSMGRSTSRGAGRSVGALLAGRGGQRTAGAPPAGRGGRRAAGTAARTTASGSTGRTARASTGRGRVGRLGGHKSSGAHSAARGGRRQRGPISTAAHKAGSAGRKFGRLAGKSAKGARTAGTRTAGAARTVAGRASRAATWADRKTGGRAGRAFGYPGRAGRRMGKAAGRGIAKHARRAGGWVDRKTGRRYSTAWHAIRGAGGFRASRRRAAAVLGGWDAQVTASLIALVALLAERWKRAKARKAAAQSGESTSETAPAGDGDLPITARIQCPRCGAPHTVTIPAEEADTWITCRCGLKIRAFLELPNDPPDDWDKTATDAPEPTQHRQPYTAHTTNRRNRMSAFPLASAAAEVNSAAASHAPADMFAVARELDLLGEVPANIAMALRTYTMRLQSEYPIHPAVVDAMGQLYAAHAQLVQAAEEIGPLFRRAHAEDLKREEAPRTNEQAWNV